MPYLFLYLAAYTDPAYISPDNHPWNMSLYPYDHTIFRPGQTCNTCQLLKPARSKHCSICKHCVSKLDHHCIFINNCVGYGNHHWFLLLLLSTGILTVYAAQLGAVLLSAKLAEVVPNWTFLGRGFSWSRYFALWGWIMQEHVGIGAVSLLCLLTSPLVWGLLAYHIRLIWGGTTTNETLKWSDWQIEMHDGYVFKGKLPTNRDRNPVLEPPTSWKADSQQIILWTEDGSFPDARHSNLPADMEWERVWSLAEVENVYDLGFWDNAMDVFASRA